MGFTIKINKTEWVCLKLKERTRILILAKLLLKHGSCSFQRLIAHYNEEYRQNESPRGVKFNIYIWKLYALGGFRLRQFRRARVIFPKRKRLEELIKHLEEQCLPINCKFCSSKAKRMAIDRAFIEKERSDEEENEDV